MSSVKRSTGHTHTPTENNTPDTGHTGQHTTRWAQSHHVEWRVFVWGFGVLFLSASPRHAARMSSAHNSTTRWAQSHDVAPSAPQAALHFDPTSHADFGAATHPGVGGGTHRRRATFERC